MHAKADTSKSGRHSCKEHRHAKQITRRQVDMHVRSVDTLNITFEDMSTRMKEVSTHLEEIFKDRSTHIHHVSAQLEECVENRPTHMLCVSTQLAVKFQGGRLTKKMCRHSV